MASDLYPLHSAAIILPVLAFPAWTLCIPPFVWHFSQRNIPAWSLVAYIILMNFFLSINPLIWPRDNVDEWYNGAGLCDIEIRFFVAMSVGLPARTAMIMRKLAKVMDTGNITLAPSRTRVIRETVLEILVCWGYPAFVALIYYVVQPVRYFIYGISGCVAPYNLSWVSIVLGAMWPPITGVFSSYYAGLLVYRLYRYRCDFHRLIAIRDTTKSRFLRLFIISAITVVVITPYSFWILWLFASQLSEDYNWSSVHGSTWDVIWKLPAIGEVRMDKWGQIAAGYMAFFVFGTGTDANNTYKRMLRAIGLGRIFPSLHILSRGGASTPSRLLTWCSTTSSKAKAMFFQNDSVTDTKTNSEEADAIMLITPRSCSLHPVVTNDPTLPNQDSHKSAYSDSFLGRLFARRSRQQSILPLFAKNHVDELTVSEKSPVGTLTVDTLTSGVYSQAWASNSLTATNVSQNAGDRSVHVVREVHQEDNFMRKNKDFN